MAFFPMKTKLITVVVREIKNQTRAAQDTICCTHITGFRYNNWRYSDHTLWYTPKHILGARNW